MNYYFLKAYQGQSLGSKAKKTKKTLGSFPILKKKIYIKTMYIFFLKWECCKCFSFFLFSFFPVFRVFSSFFLSFSGFPLGWGRCFVVLALWSLLRRLRSVCSLGSLGSLVGCFFVVLGVFRVARWGILFLA